MPRYSLGEALGRRTYICVGAEGLLLATDAGNIETYARTCLICQQDKADHQKKTDLLQPLPIPMKPWEIVSMDYISGLPKLCFDAQKSSSTNKSAFKIVTGQQPLLPHTLDSPQSVRSPLARSFSQEWKHNVDITRSCLEKAQKRMKKYADQNRRFIEFSAGDLVIVKVPDPRLSKSSRGEILD
ncbi:UNVERIFIED_CONTAM: hypothetical protein Slati_0996100 [Sesamum latifolium]|uniref:Uncharacterized protein n=1 Tax=Sesamum latifolium TaxID=2727402 RepID=A0AAW2XTX3_9LAMI